jgi:predicted transcriptional regulator
MKTLKSDLLDDFTDETVVPEPNESKLNIYVRHPTVSALLSKLDELIQSIETRSITLDDRVNKKLSKESLKEVARVTKTYLKHNRTRAVCEHQARHFSSLDSNGLQGT